jgi:hypothetical protein
MVVLSLPTTVLFCITAVDVFVVVVLPLPIPVPALICIIVVDAVLELACAMLVVPLLSCASIGTVDKTKIIEKKIVMIRRNIFVLSKKYKLNDLILFKNELMFMSFFSDRKKIIIDDIWLLI